MSSFPQSADSVPVDKDQPAPARGTSEPAVVTLSRLETTVIVAALAVLGVLRWCSIYSHAWNSDEPQHLHVVWAWTVGRLQYRDVFDNHTPLFHMLNAPLLRWLGERADIVQPMRMAMIPLFAVGIWCVYRLAAIVYDRRTGWFAALLAAALPAFFFRMGEFRTDVMWAVVWLLALVVAVGGRASVWRTLGAAIIIGAAFSVSMKTTFLVLCLVVSGIVTWWFAGRPFSKGFFAHAFAAVIGVAIVPGAIVAYFASQGALKPLYHCVIEHNTLPGQNVGQMILHQIFARSSALWLIPAGIFTAAMLPSVRRDPRRGYRRLFLFLVTSLYYPLLRIFWPVVTTQDYLPWLPLLPIFAVAGWSWWREHFRKVPLQRVPWICFPALLLLGEIVWIVVSEPPFVWNGHHLQVLNIEERRIRHLASLLRLADPGEYVFDTKGETIFRPRPIYMVMETLTLQQIKDGRIPDDTIPRLIETRTAVCVQRMSNRLMPATQQFIEKNYLRANGVRTLGQRIEAVLNAAVAFEVIIPERYGFIAPSGAVTGTLDGRPLDGPRWLDAGRHELTVAKPAGEVSLLWARALERGYSPYAESDARTAE